MATLNLTFAVEITEEEEEFLPLALGCTAQGLETELNLFGPTALREYIEMFTGAGAITTATEVRERRLLGLMLSRFQAASPNPDTIARLFNITPSAARALLRSVAGKYRLKLGNQLEAAIKSILDNAIQQANGGYTVIINNALVLELLNAELAAADTSRTAIRPNKDSINNFAIDQGSYGFLRGLHP
jgi:hypothetical protein